VTYDGCEPVLTTWNYRNTMKLQLSETQVPHTTSSVGGVYGLRRGFSHRKQEALSRHLYVVAWAMGSQ